VPIAIGCGAIGAAAYVAAADPSSTGTYPACIVRSVTGWSCPGCGLTRATHHLLRGDVAQALGANALIVPVLVMLMLTWGGWLLWSLGRRPSWLHRAAVPAWLGLATVAAPFTILRNLESFDVLRR
jgi:hypothetical protein